MTDSLPESSASLPGAASPGLPRAVLRAIRLGRASPEARATERRERLAELHDPGARAAYDAAWAIRGLLRWFGVGEIAGLARRGFRIVEILATGEHFASFAYSRSGRGGRHPRHRIVSVLDPLHEKVEALNDVRGRRREPGGGDDAARTQAIWLRDGSGHGRPMKPFMCSTRLRRGNPILRRPRRGALTPQEEAMQASPLVLAIALIAAAPVPVLAQDGVVDSLAVAREYTEWLYAGEADSLSAHTTAEAGAELTADRYARVSDMIAERAGFELDMEETWKLRGGDCQYWRTATFSNMEGPFLLRWVLNHEGKITGLGLGPYAQAPPVEADTCAPSEENGE